MGGRALLPNEVASSRVYTGTQSERFARASRWSPETSPGRPCGRPGGDVSVTVKRYCFFDTEMFAWSMIPISKSSAVSMTPCTYGFKRYLVAE